MFLAGSKLNCVLPNTKFVLLGCNIDFQPVDFNERLKKYIPFQKIQNNLEKQNLKVGTVLYNKKKLNCRYNRNNK